MLRRLVLTLTMGLLLVPYALPANSASPSARDAAEIRKVIEAQLDAFQRDDSATAFSYASPGIQQKFGDPATFMEMVRTEYQAVYRPLEVEIRELRVVGSTVAQEVLFVGLDTETVIAIYSMQQQPDDSWRINGVLLFAAPDVVT